MLHAGNKVRPGLKASPHCCDVALAHSHNQIHKEWISLITHSVGKHTLKVNAMDAQVLISMRGSKPATSVHI